MDELDERSIKYSSFKTSSSFRNKLIKETEGIQRVPRLLLTCPEKDLTSVGCMILGTISRIYFVKYQNRLLKEKKIVKRNLLTLYSLVKTAKEELIIDLI